MITQPRYIILLGPPASGKGTQATRLREALHLPHVASGDLFRENLKQQTGLGLKAKSYMDRGELVPDDVTIAMVIARLEQPDCSAGAILDGFPRTIAQGVLQRLTLPVVPDLLSRRLSQIHHRPALQMHLGDLTAVHRFPLSVIRSPFLSPSPSA